MLELMSAAEPTRRTPREERTSREELVEKRVAHVIRLRTGGAIQGLRIDVADEHVRLSGRTQSFYHKQLATHAAMDTLDEESLSNEIVVHSALLGSSG